MKGREAPLRKKHHEEIRLGLRRVCRDCGEPKLLAAFNGADPCCLICRRRRHRISDAKRLRRELRLARDWTDPESTV